LTTTRLTDPAMEIGDLPPLDLVLLSHFHGDHFDQVAERELDRSLPIVTTPEASRELAERGFANTVPLETWDRVTVRKGERSATITSTPGRHGPGITDLALPDVMGSVLEADGMPRLYLSGDTLVFDGLHEIPRRHPDLDVALLHLGGTRVMGVLVTMDAEQGVEAMRIVDARTTIPIHYDDYDVMTSGLPEFLQAATDAGWRDRVTPLHRGDTHRL
jgi:L-ascorbate metabolism protein UlaG (beta-lactamase superfamily)